MSQNFKLMLKNADDGFLRPLIGTRRQPRLPASDDQEILPLVRSLFLTPESRHAPRSVVFVSVEAAGHSASVCVRVAKALAASGAGTVCIVDANLSDPSMHRTFAVPQEPGFAGMLEHGSRLVTHEVEPGLCMLPAGHAPIGVRGGITTDAATVLIGGLRSSFDWVLADVGPVGSAGDLWAVAPSAEGVVLVVAANLTRRAVALKVKQEIVAAGGRLLGTVLTDRAFPIPEPVYRRL